MLPVWYSSFKVRKFTLPAGPHQPWFRGGEQDFERKTHLLAIYVCAMFWWPQLAADRWLKHVWLLSSKWKRKVISEEERVIAFLITIMYTNIFYHYCVFLFFFVLVGKCMLTVVATSTSDLASGRTRADVSVLAAVELMVRVSAEDIFNRTLPVFFHHLQQMLRTHNSLFMAIAN